MHRLFDFQVNGFGGVDFQRDELTASQFVSALTMLRSHGVACIFATLITDRIDTLCRRFQQLERFRKQDKSVREMIAGYHLEGPWLSPEEGFRGAHPSDRMTTPTIADFDLLQEAAHGEIRLVTIAPELPGCMELIDNLTKRGVHVSLGHTNASDDQIDDAVTAGARFCTHLGNGAPEMLPRHNNIIQRLLARDELIACFIPDGVHLPSFVLRNFVRAKPPGRVLFTTDAMAGAGAPPGRYTIGKLEIDVGSDGIARLPQGTGLAGSTLAPDDGVRRVADYLGLSLAESRRLWSDAPAEAFGVKFPAILS